VEHILHGHFRHLRNGQFSLGAVGTRHNVTDTGAGMLHLLKMGLRRAVGVWLHGREGGHMGEGQMPQAWQLQVAPIRSEAWGVRRRGQGRVVRCGRERIVGEGGG
jgi:hypothetical protein